MKKVLHIAVILLAAGGFRPILVVAAAQEQRPRVAISEAGQAAATKPGVADGGWSPALTGDRRPLYRLSAGDVVEIAFPISPEFNQTVSVQPDGFIGLYSVGAMFVQGATVVELQARITTAYSQILKDPEVNIVLRDFQRPYFVATGEVTRPGRYELRGPVTVMDAVAMAGGFSAQARNSQVVLFRRTAGAQAEASVIDVKRMLHRRELAEDVQLRTGDLLFVPRSTLSKVRGFLPSSSLGLYGNPAQF